ncbi:MAG: hypothetical protein V4657_09395 [Pseudomonadota bacterium]
MSVDQAAAYVGISATKLREIGPPVVSMGEMRRVLYDRKDLDRWVDRLSGQPLDGPQIEAETNSVESRLLEKIRGKA